MNQSISEDYLDRFSEVAKGLGLSKDIANKLANFIHYEVLSEKKKALTADRKELREKVEGMKTYTGGSSVNEKDKRVNKQEVLSLLEEK